MPFSLVGGECQKETFPGAVPQRPLTVCEFPSHARKEPGSHIPGQVTDKGSDSSTLCPWGESGGRFLICKAGDSHARARRVRHLAQSKCEFSLRTKNWNSLEGATTARSRECIQRPAPLSQLKVAILASDDSGSSVCPTTGSRPGGLVFRFCL